MIASETTLAPPSWRDEITMARARAISCRTFHLGTSPTQWYRAFWLISSTATSRYVLSIALPIWTI